MTILEYFKYIYLRSIINVVKNNLDITVRLEVLTEMKIHVTVYWILTQCSEVVGYQCFGGPCCMHLQGVVKMKATRPYEMVS
jgi:hypothetical protein